MARRQKIVLHEFSTATLVSKLNNTTLMRQSITKLMLGYRNMLAILTHHYKNKGFFLCHFC